MGQFPGSRSIIKPLAFALITAVGASVANAAPTWADPADRQPGRPSKWEAEQLGDKGLVRLSRRGPQGALHAICSTTECNLFVEPKSGCQPGSKYPLLVNSADHMGVIPSRCVMVKASDGPKLVVHLAQSKNLVRQMIRGTDVSIGFPAHQGHLDVLNIEMKGAAKLLAVALSAAGQGNNSTDSAKDSEAARQARAKATANAALRAAIERASNSRYKI